MSMMLSCLDPDDPTPASAVLPGHWLEEETFARFDAEGNVRRWIDTLLAGGETDEAIRLIAHVLPPRYTLAWACEALRTIIDACTGDGYQVERVGIALAERWLKDPSESNRRAALDFAEGGAFKRPGEWIAAAAGWAGGSLAPSGPEFAPVLPPPWLAAEAACAAILSAGWQLPTQRAALMQTVATRALETFGKTEPVA